MNPVLFKLLNLEIRWYSVLVLVAFILGFFLVVYRSRKRCISPALIYDMSFYLLIFCILGARLYYCLFNLDYYKENLIEVLKIWQGGLAIHGGIIAGIIFLFVYTKKHGIEFFNLTDLIAPSLALGQAIGRWGNFFNQEAYGSATTIFELKKLHVPNFVIDGMYINGTYHHPTFLYESVACLIIFIILKIVSIKSKRGQLTGVYFILYGIVRYFIESLRTDSLMLSNFKVAQIISILMIIIGLVLIVVPVFRRNYDK